MTPEEKAEIEYQDRRAFYIDWAHYQSKGMGDKETIEREAGEQFDLKNGRIKK